MKTKIPSVCPVNGHASPPRMVTYGGQQLASLPQVATLPVDLRRDIEVVAAVLPFKVNNYVLENLIDWTNVPNDPIFRLTFPHRDMLEASDFDTVAALHDRGAPPAVIREAADQIRLRLNPHPGEQLAKNVPVMDEDRVHGLQHKYRETVLFFPAKGQTCHAYCAYCFRWAQFVQIASLRQEARETASLASYLRRHRFVTDVLVTGGDPMIMSTQNLERYLSPLLADDLDHVKNLRIGTKALAYWPFRFTTDPDADRLLRLLEAFANRGRHVAIMAHSSHPVELEPPVVREAVKRLRDVGAVIRTQSPVVRHVNDSSFIWADLWTKQVALGMVPYYMFVERDTGARRYFELPLVEAFEIYRDAISSVSGIARTARGPSMSATPGKVVIDGVETINGERVFCLRFLQARNPDWCNRPFFARFDPKATWLDHLRPAFGAGDQLFCEQGAFSWLGPSSAQS